MKKLVFCIGLLTMSSFVHAAAEDKTFTLMWDVGIPGKVFLPGQVKPIAFAAVLEAGRELALSFSPPAGVSSPIGVKFAATPVGKTLEIALPKGVASWDALPDATEITIVSYSTKHKIWATLQLPLKINLADERKESTDATTVMDSSAIKSSSADRVIDGLRFDSSSDD